MRRVDRLLIKVQEAYRQEGGSGLYPRSNY